MKNVYTGPFHFSPWVKIETFDQLNKLVGKNKWQQIEMTKEQAKDYDGLLFHYGKECGNPCQKLTINGIPIKIYKEK